MAGINDLRLVQPQSLTAMVTDRLREAIIDGQFALGENISEDRLTSVFGVSRSPVRDALAALQFTGLVEVRPKRGSFVFSPSLDDVAELCQFRFMLEREAARLAHAADRDVLIAAIETLIATMERAEAAGDTRAYAQADTAFHTTFFDLCGNALVRNAYQLADARIATLRTVLTAQYDERRRSSFDEHREMLAAFRADDLATFETILHEHVDRTRRVASQQLTSRREDTK
ncbi:GntR family transcriptional regulator [Frigidibacter sp. MR17.24]|uniref:GntR family transcriptional regulator n=1 Tax=Frigidibacter sp. MR17.24 TaxID=3127345 RepID=UPI003012CD79